MRSSKERERGTLKEGTPASFKGIEELKSKMQDMQLEIDILKEIVNVIKKDPGISKIPLNNREKAVIVDALKGNYTLPLLLKKLTLAKSSYYYQKKRLSFTAKHENDYKIIVSAFYENKQRYGYRRIKVLLDRKGYSISEKVIRRIMRENRRTVKGKIQRNTVLIGEKFVLLFQMLSRGIFAPASQIRNGLRM